MTHSEKVGQLLDALKSATPDKAKEIFSSVIELIPLLSNSEKETSAVGFYTWTQEHAVLRRAQNDKSIRRAQNDNSIRQAQNDNSNNLLAYGKYMMGLNAFWHERHEEALRYLGEAQNMFRELDDADGVALASGGLGATYRTLGNFDLALRELWEGYKQLKKSGSYRHNMLACGYQVGSIYLEMKSYDEALPVFTEILKQAEDTQNNVWIANASQGLGKLNRALNRLPEAKAYIDEALSTAEDMKNPMFVANMLTDMAEYHLLAGDAGECEKLHKRALEIRESHKFLGGAITNYTRLAELYIQQGKPGAAVDMLQKGMTLAQQLKVKPKIFAIHKLLAELYESQNDVGKSLAHYKQYYELRDEVEREDNVKKVKNLQTIFEAEQTRKENIIIKKQKAEIEQKNIALQETIDELTRTKVGKKAKAFTLIIAIVLFILEELILHYIVHLLPEDNFYLSFVVKMVIIFSLKPIDSAIEHYLLKKIIRKKKYEVVTI